MKKTALFIFFGLLCLAATAQTGAVVVTKDTTWQEYVDTVFFLNRRVEWNNGEFSQTRTLIGNQTTVFKSALNQSISEGVRMANVAWQARDNDKTIKGIIKLSDSLLLQIGRDLSDTLTARYSPPLLVAGWTIKEGGVESDMQFSVNSSGALRYVIAGYPLRGATIISNTLRLNNYKATGKSLDIYRAPGGNWFSIDDTVKLKHPTNAGLND